MSVTAPILKSASSLGEIIRFELLTYSASIYLGFFLIAVYTSTEVLSIYFEKYLDKSVFLTYYHACT